MHRESRSTRPTLVFLAVLSVLLCFAILLLGLPFIAAHRYGPPSASLTAARKIEYSARLLWYDGLLTRPLDRLGPKQPFVVEPGESVASVAHRLYALGLIYDASVFRDYLIYAGLDTSLQAGRYELSPSMSIVDIAHAMQDATPTEVTFVILPGWRLEEIAASLPTSGLRIAPQDFLDAARNPPQGFDFLSGAASTEGFLYPDAYLLPRTATPAQVVETFVRGFALHLTADLQMGFERQGLSTAQAVTLASIIQREAMHEEEAPLLASVFLNRLRAGMKLEADPTVQYALGYNAARQTWWTNPLSLTDLQIDSPYNTYRYSGLPPAPISNPGLVALQAVAFPAQTDYYFFRARCDGSGFHEFAQTFEEHLQNVCP